MLNKKIMRALSVILVFIICLPIASQNPTFDELVIEADSITSAYKVTGKDFAFIKSKRGSEGVTKTFKADSILALPITDIVLVFSELNTNSINNRLEANQERWENLIKTYPQFFQPATNLKEMCQCKIGGDTAIYKKGQGFYVYFEVEKPKVFEKKVEEKKVVQKEEVAVEKSKDKKEKNKEEPVKEKKVKEKKEKEVEKIEEKTTKNEKTETKEEPVAEVVKEVPTKRAGYAKPKRSKDTKACRPACYEGGDEGLATFFKESLVLTKKQRKQFKSSICNVKLQLNFDGTIKKSFITGEDAELNKLIQGSVNAMNTWYPAVKSGVTVKSEVKMVLKYDKESKSIKPSEVSAIPRPAPKCMECKTDAEIFGAE